MKHPAVVEQVRQNQSNAVADSFPGGHIERRRVTYKASPLQSQSSTAQSHKT
jgi:hypothetical protein